MNKRVLALLAIAFAPARVFAIDGVTLINQSTVMANGGFPYVISQPGSYKLSGNLAANDSNTSVIVIASDNVTVDLNSFAITGPTDCSVFPCAGPGNGDGILIFTTRIFSHVTIRNGTIQGMGRCAVELANGDSFLVEYLQIQSNGFCGIFTGGTAILQHNIVLQNGQIGISAAGIIQENIASNNALIGIRGQGLITHNTVERNGSDGLALGPNAGFAFNILIGNGVQEIGGFNLGGNICNGALCP